MKAKPIEPSGTAQQRVTSKNQIATVPEDKLAPESQQALAAGRAMAARQNAERSAGTKPALADDLPTRPPVAVDEQVSTPLPFEVVTERVIQIWDGRHVVLGPPDIFHGLTVPRILDENERSGPFRADALAKMAKIFQYVRAVGNFKLPGSMGTLAEIEGLARNLGELGCRAVYEAYQESWPDYQRTSWVDIKKSVSAQNSAR